MQLLRFHLMEDVGCESEIKQELEKKLDKMVMRDLYGKFKTAPTEEERERARKEYLRGTPLYRADKEKTGKEKHTMREGRLGYNCENGRYGLLSMDLWVDTGFHCGECMEVLVDDKWVKTRMEMNPAMEWYLVGTPYCGDLEYVRARIPE